MIRTLALSLVLLSAPALASAPPTPVRPLEGYACLKLRMTEAQALNPSGSGIYIQVEPDSKAPAASLAPSIVFVKSPIQTTANGYIQVMQLNGRPGWIKAADVNLIEPDVRCVPMLMSDGRPGIG